MEGRRPRDGPPAQALQNLRNRWPVRPSWSPGTPPATPASPARPRGVPEALPAPSLAALAGRVLLLSRQPIVGCRTEKRQRRGRGHPWRTVDGVIFHSDRGSGVHVRGRRQGVPVSASRAVCNTVRVTLAEQPARSHQRHTRNPGLVDQLLSNPHVQPRRGPPVASRRLLSGAVSLRHGNPSRPEQPLQPAGSPPHTRSLGQSPSAEGLPVKPGPLARVIQARS